jgi:hypothetical protein
MNDFIKKLIEEVYTEVVGRDVYAIYPGRFHPAGPHHYQVYQWLANKFGEDKVFIATSDKVELPDSPLNFDEKKTIWMKYGVPANKIIKTVSPYTATEVLDLLPEGSSIVFGFGKKDAERFKVGGTKKDGSPAYLQFYEQNKDNLQDFTKNGYLIIVPHFSLKVDGKELSGTEIRNMIAYDPSEETFKKIFGWYDPKIAEMLSEKFKESQNYVKPEKSAKKKSKKIKESRSMFSGIVEDADLSYVKKEALDATIKNVLKENGLDKIEYSKIGNISKPLLGDIDVAIDTADIIKFLKLPETATKDEIFDAIPQKIKGAKIAKGLNQFHLLGKAVGQKFVNVDGSEDPNKIPYVQVDIMLGVRKWREKFYSGAPGSEYKAKFRNLFLAEIMSKIIEDAGPNGLKQKYMLSPAEGFFLQKFTIDAKGKRKEISRELKSTDMDFVATFLFGEDKTFADIDTFEKVYTLFKSKDFKFPQLRQEIMDAYKENMAKSQKAEPDLPHPKLEESTVVEAKLSIQRFSGANEMSDAEFLRFLQKIQPLVKQGRMDLSVTDQASVTEKLDGSPCKWGLNANGQFFMESANSGEVTVGGAEKFNNPFTVHFYQTLIFLNGYKPFQAKLQAVKNKHGAFKVSSEMFPVLTHKGDELGDIVFASTKYNKSKLGNKGAFVCFGATCEKHGEEKSAEIVQMLESPEDPEWKIYNINKHGSLSREGLVFNLAGIQKLIGSPDKLSQAEALLRSRKESPEKDALKKIMAKVKQQMQGVLDQYAERINTFLSSDPSRQYPVEGVVLKIDLPDEPIFIKGTSEIFHKIAEKTWGTRKAAGNTEKVLDGDFLTKVLGLSTSHAATLNKSVAAAKQKTGETGGDDVSANKIALEVYNQLKREGEDMSPKAIKARAMEVIGAAQKEFQETKAQWEKLKKGKEVDPDTIEKTESQLSFLQKKVDNINQAIVKPPYQGEAYIVYLLRMLLDKRIKSSSETSG